VVTYLIIAICFAIALILLCAGLLGYVIALPSISDPTPPAANEDLNEEQLEDLGEVRHASCFDLYLDDSPACAECTPVLDAWWARRKATA
jgi:hypothetical protein